MALIDRFFPVPSFLDVPFLGIDISDHSLRYMVLKKTGEEWEVELSGNKRIPDGIITKGIISQKEQLAAILGEVRRESKISFARVSLPEEQAYIFELVIPRLGLDDIRNSVELQLEEHVPLPSVDAVFDFEIISKEKDTFLLTVTAFPRNIVEAYSEVFEKTGLIPISMEVESQAIARAVIERGSKKTYMVVDFGESRTGISVVTNGRVAFTSTVDIGGGRLTEAISKHFSLSQEDAENMKREYGILQSGKGKEVFLAVLNSISALRDEINRHYIYWHTHKDEKGMEHPKIDTIILCGGDSNLKGAAEYFEASLHIPTQKANVWQNINSLKSYVPPISYSNSLTYATALGLCATSYD